MKWAVWSLLALVIAAVAGPANAQPVVACGDTVTHDVTLTASLTGCSTGLVVGADGITIDLNGFSIEGVGADGSVGIEANGRSGVAVRSGKVRGFATGVRYVSTVRSTISGLTIRDTVNGIFVGHSFVLPSIDANVVSWNIVKGGETGITSFGQGDQTLWNKVVGASRNGIFVRGSITLGIASLVANNRVSEGEVGIFQFDCTADLVENTITDNRSDGVRQWDSHSTLVDNRVTHNGGNGIIGADTHALYRQNVTNSNAGHGLFFNDVFGDHGHFMEVTRHTANENGGYGIFTPLQGVVDGGKNRAHGNGSDVECVGVVCK